MRRIYGPSVIKRCNAVRELPKAYSSREIFGNDVPKKVKIVEVGARDGLQNESKSLDVPIRVELVRRLRSAGLPSVEAGSFVHPKMIPQLANTDQVLREVLRQDPQGAEHYSVLVPNMKGFDAAVASGAKEVLVFTAAGESFCKRNINCGIEESIERFKPVFSHAHKLGIKVRGCVSTIFADPFEGPIDPRKVTEVAARLHDLGAYEVMLGDTTGVGTPGTTAALMEEITKVIPASRLAVHFHDTYGQALANILVALRYGVMTIDSAVSGLGGCPYARGASGNVSTEDVVYMLHGMGISTGVDLKSVIETGWWLASHLGKLPVSRVSRALHFAGEEQTSSSTQAAALEAALREKEL